MTDQNQTTVNDVHTIRLDGDPDEIASTIALLAGIHAVEKPPAVELVTQMKLKEAILTLTKLSESLLVLRDYAKEVLHERVPSLEENSDPK